MSKAGRPKKGSAGLPDWFDIRNYAQAKNYGALEWFYQLAFRVEISKYGVSDWPRQWFNLIKTNVHVTYERVEALRPKTNKTSSESFERAKCDMMLRAMSASGRAGTGIDLLRNSDLVRGAITEIPYSFRCLVDLKSSKADKALIKEAEEKWREEQKKPWRGNQFGKNKYFQYVRLDLTLPDELLKKNFADFLQEQRKELKEINTPFFKNQDFADWYNSGALPLIDLMLGEKLEETSFRWSVFADALNEISDKPIGSEDTCRKTAKALALRLLDEGTVRVLQYQASMELASVHKKSGKLLVK